MSVKKKILYAEDEVSNRIILQIKLEKAGYICEVVENGEQAIVQFKQDNYSFVILDQHMPGMNGDLVAYELLKFLP